MYKLADLPEEDRVTVETIIGYATMPGYAVSSVNGVAHLFPDRAAETRSDVLRRAPQPYFMSNMRLSENYIPQRPENWAFPMSSVEAISARPELPVREAREDAPSYEINELFALHMSRVHDIILYYGTDDEIRQFYAKQDDLLRQVLEHILTCGEPDPRAPFKTLNTHYAKVAKQLSGPRPDQTVKPYELFNFVANAVDPDILPSAPYVKSLKEAANRAFEGSTVYDGDHLYAAMAKIMDDMGYNLTGHQVRHHVKCLLSREDQEAMLRGVPRWEKKDPDKIGPAIARPSSIKVVDAAVAMVADTLRGGQSVSSSLQGSPYADMPKSGRRKYAFRQNF